MPERTAERERTRTRDSRSDIDFDTDVDIDGLPADSGERSGTERTTNSEGAADVERRGLRTRLRDRRRGLFSLRVFVGTLLGALAAGLLGGAIPILGSLIGGFAGLIGVFGAAFVVGLASSGRHYTESGLAGAAAAGVILVLSNLSVTFLAVFRDILPEIGVIGAGAGLLAALVGHYFGRDLREGLTADI